MYLSILMGIGPKLLKDRVSMGVRTLEQEAKAVTEANLRIKEARHPPSAGY